MPTYSVYGLESTLCSKSVPFISLFSMCSLRSFVANNLSLSPVFKTQRSLGFFFFFALLTSLLR